MEGDSEKMIDMEGNTTPPQTTTAAAILMEVTEAVGTLVEDGKAVPGVDCRGRSVCAWRVVKAEGEGAMRRSFEARRRDRGSLCHSGFVRGKGIDFGLGLGHGSGVEQKLILAPGDGVHA